MESEDSGRKKTLLVALGGNALIRGDQRGTIEEQLENLRVPLRQVAALSKDYRIIITHGNGPQVGDLLLQQECCETVPRLPLEILVAQTQGQIGYMIESTLDSELMALGMDSQPLVSLLSYVLVDEDDPAFKNPTKPIGPAFPNETNLPYPTVKTPKGYRRVVASPEPRTIIEKREIRTLIELDFIVITCGGGGIPVVKEGRSFAGVDAVIDKDLASSRLAEEVGVDVFVIATDVEGVAVGYGTPEQRFLDRITIEEAEQYLYAGEFPPGSMGPKVQACTRFLQAGGERAVVTSIDRVEEAVAGAAGTEFLKE
ncbi:MAG: carbamate kinase [Acidobacteriota bacterium]